MSTPVETLEVGRALGPLELTVSAEGNRRYWSAAGVDHPLLRSGVLYPPIAANLTILLAQTVVEHQMLHTHQHLVCHALARAGEQLSIRGEVTRRFAKRRRTYVEIAAVISNSSGPVWESTARFTSA
jgi:hypothetical protein